MKTATHPSEIDATSRKVGYSRYEIPAESKPHEVDVSPSLGSDEAIKSGTVENHFEIEQTPPIPRRNDAHLLPSPDEHWTPRSDVTSTEEDAFAVDLDEIVVDESQMTPAQLRELEDEEERIDAAIRESERLMDLRRQRDELQNRISAAKGGPLS